MRVNDEIRSREIRVIGSNGEQAGVMSVRDGLKMAQESGLDLVEVAPNAKPPVCRIMDFGKYMYEQSKREREARKKQKVISIKEIRMTPKIDSHDLEVKTKNAIKFLQDGDKVKVTIRFRGREIVHADLSKRLLTNLADTIKGYGAVEREPRVEGRNMIMILTPKQDKREESDNAKD